MNLAGERSRRLRLNLICVTVLISFLLYIFALQQDCFLIDPKRPHAMPTFAIVVLGFFAVFGGEISWLANGCLVGAWMMMRWQHDGYGGIGFASASLLLALSFLFRVGGSIMTPDGGGVTKEIVGVGPGYWLWILSIVVTLAGSVVVLLMNHSSVEASKFDTELDS